MRGGAEHRERAGDDFAHLADEPHLLGSSRCIRPAASYLLRVRELAAKLACAQPAAHMSDVTSSGKIVAATIDDRGLLRHARDGFEVQAMLEPLEGSLDPPALMVKVGEQRRGELCDLSEWPALSILPMRG